MDLKDVATRTEAAEEFVVAHARSAESHKSLNRIIAVVRQALRSLGFSLKFSDSEIKSLVARAGEAKATAVGGETLFNRLQTGTQNFKNWFNKSVVTEEIGETGKMKPMVVYHGTSRSFDAFSDLAEPANVHPHQDDNKLGFFFAQSPVFADDFAKTEFNGDTYRPGANLVPVYVSLQNPAMYSEFDDLGIEIKQAGSVEAFKKQLISEGFDGVAIYPEHYGDDWGINRTTYVAFSPTQIKSATGNNGDFSPTNPDIRYSRTTSLTPAKAKSLIRDTEGLEARDFKAFAEQWNDLPDQITVYRAVAAESQEAVETGEFIGEHWAMNKDAALQFSEENGLSGKVFVMKLLVNKSDVDMQESLNAWANHPDEQELTIPYGTPVAEPEVRTRGEARKDIRFSRTPQELHQQDLATLSTLREKSESNIKHFITQTMPFFGAPTDRLLKAARVGNVITGKFIKMFDEYQARVQARTQMRDRYSSTGQERAIATERSGTKEQLQAHNDLTTIVKDFHLYPGKDIAAQGYTEESWRKNGYAPELSLQEALDKVNALWDKLGPKLQTQWGKNSTMFEDLAKAVRKGLQAQNINNTLETSTTEPLEWRMRGPRGNLIAVVPVQDEATGFWVGKNPTAANYITPLYQTKEELTRTLKPWGEREQGAQDIDAMFKTIGPYRPDLRFGSTILTIYEKKEDGTKGARLSFSAYENPADARNMAEQATAEGYIAVAGEQQTHDFFRSVVPNAMMQRLEKMFVGLGVSEEEKNMMREQVALMWLSTTQENTGLMHRMKRKGVLGASPDSLRSMVAYTSRMGTLIANLTHGQEVANIMRDIDTERLAHDETQATARAAGDKQTLKAYDGVALGKFMNELRDREKRLVQNTANPVVSALVQGTALKMLFSPSMMLVQSTQPFIFAAPAMGVRHNLIKANAELAKQYYRQMGKKDGQFTFSNERLEQYRDKAYEIVDAEATGNTERVARLWADATTPEARLLLGMQVAMARGAINITLTHEAQEMIKQGSQSKFSKMMAMSMFFMQTSEIASRKATFAAAYELEYGKLTGEGMAAPQAAEAATNYAIEIINENLFNYSTPNKPSFIVTDVGRTVAQFKIFQLHTWFKIGNLTGQALNMKNGFTAAEAKAARQELAGLAGMTMLFSGAVGVPFLMPSLQIISAALNLFGDPDDPWDLETDFKNYLQNQGRVGVALASGIPAAFGADISRSVGQPMEWVQGEPPESFTARQRYAWYAMKNMGPLISGVGPDLHAALSGETYEKQGMTGVLATVMPRAFANVAKAYQAKYGEGVKTASGKVLLPPDQVGIYEGILMALGLNPTELALKRENQQDVTTMSQRISKRKAAITAHFVKSILAEDAEGKEKAIEEVKAFSVAHPAFAYKASELVGAVKIAKMEAMGIDTKRETKIKMFEMPQEEATAPEEE
jgi:hypothetical protein